MRLLRAAPLLLLAALPLTARAHDSTISSSEIAVGADSVEVRLKTRGVDLAFAVEGLDANGDGTLSDEEMAGGHAVLESYLLGKVEISLDGKSCPGRLESARRIEESEILQGQSGHPSDALLVLRYALPSPPGRVGFRIHPFDDNDPYHQHLARISLLGAPARTVFFSGGSYHEEAAPTPGGAAEPAAASASVSGAVRLGVEHILTGWDHLLFLAALILVVQTPWSLLAVITGFTVGHSITLVLAGLDVVSLPARFTDSAVAFSIAYVGFENTRSNLPKRRWLVAMLFGLVHGFGFAASLRGRLPQDALVLSLLLFNLGIEAGQLAVVAMVWPVLRTAANWETYAKWGPKALSWGISAVGAALCVARIRGVAI